MDQLDLCQSENQACSTATCYLLILLSCLLPALFPAHQPLIAFLVLPNLGAELFIHISSSRPDHPLPFAGLHTPVASPGSSASTPAALPAACRLEGSFCCCSLFTSCPSASWLPCSLLLRCSAVSKSLSGPSVPWRSCPSVTAALGLFRAWCKP